jgi:hypothetical protein
MSRRIVERGCRQGEPLDSVSQVTDLNRRSNLA